MFSCSGSGSLLEIVHAVRSLKITETLLPNTWLILFSGTLMLIIIIDHFINGCKGSILALFYQWLQGFDLSTSTLVTTLVQQLLNLSVGLVT